jgi:hypothetical protein
MKLSWSCASTLSNFVIDEGEPNDWTRVKSVSSATTSYSATWTDTNDTHQFRVGAVNASGIAWSNYLVNVGGTVIDHPEISGDNDPLYVNVSGTLFGNSNQPSFTDVRQGDLGDCWLLASLAEVAYRDPQAIKQMITPDGSALEYGVEANLYKVRLYDSKGVAHEIVVDTEFPDNMDANSPSYADQVVNGVLWVALVEKAYAQANGEGFVTTGHVGVDRYSALNDGNPAWALQAITGQPASTPPTALDPSAIVSDWTANQFVVLSTSSTARNPDIVGDANGTHAYALIGCPSTYTASSASASASPVANYNANATTASLPFELYNPWGTDASGWALGQYNGHAPYGLFTANWACISQNFRHYSQGSPEAVPAETGDDQTNMQRAAQTATDLVLATWGI